MSNCFNHVFEPLDPQDPRSPYRSFWIIRYGDKSCQIDSDLEGLKCLKEILDPEMGTLDWSFEHHREVRRVWLSGALVFSTPDRTRVLSKAKLDKLTADLNAEAKTAKGEEYVKLQQQIVATRQYRNLKRTFTGEGMLTRDAARKKIDRAFSAIRIVSPELADYFTSTITREGSTWFTLDTDSVWDVSGEVLGLDGEDGETGADLGPAEPTPEEILIRWIAETTETLRQQIARSLGRRLLKRTGITRFEIENDIAWATSRRDEHPAEKPVNIFSPDYKGRE